MSCCLQGKPNETWFAVSCHCSLWVYPNKAMSTLSAATTCGAHGSTGLDLRLEETRDGGNVPVAATLA